MDSSDSETRTSTAPFDSRARDGFTPGSVFTERYRIVSLLGRGAMGEVYRAEDMRLGQPVALKFLPESLTHDAEARERLFAEARHARSIAHPNVCRVYDVGEFNARVFLTMEYIDGEDLASLLRRIGRLPGAKALEIARQLCAGLSAAHDQGILHRDLKPSNVMIDGRGTARITDFGLAVNAEQTTLPADCAGTMPYMAPERFRGAPATVQSDLYALGLILYETFTGQRAFSAPTATLEEWRSVHDSSAPARPLTLANDIDVATDRVILRCLEKDPTRRPPSAARVAASLPGGDPLAAAIAAGETPSPALVAASGAEGTLPRRVAWGVLAACVVSLAAAAGAWQWRSLINMVAPGGNPEVLQATARSVLEDLGYTAAPHDHAWWIEADAGYRRYLANTGPSGNRFRNAARAVPSPLWFLYRESPQDFKPQGVDGIVNAIDPAPLWEGEALVQLDSRGRLMSLRVVPPLTDPRDAESSREPDWNRLIALAELSDASLKPAASQWVPPAAFDVRRAWTGSLNGEPVRFEAAAYRGRVVFARWSGAWNDPDASPNGKAVGASAGRAVAVAADARSVLWIVTFGAVALLARRNLRLGRGDRRGAIRVAAFVLAFGAVASVAGRHWIFEPVWIWATISTRLGEVLFNTAMVWLSYLGFEPFVRRSWPHLLIGWTRLIDGRWRDPLVGQALLAGVLFGTLLPLVATLPETASQVLGLNGAQPYFSIWALRPTTMYLAGMASDVGTGVMNPLALVAFMVAARFVLRDNRIVLIVTAGVAMLPAISGATPSWLDWAQAAISGIAAVWFVRRYGLLAFAAGLAINGIVRGTPWTFDPSAWFVWRAALTPLLVLGPAVWGFLNVLGRQSLLSDAGFEV